MSFTSLLTVKTIAKRNPKQSDKFKRKLKTSLCGSRSPDNLEFGHFTLLFCKGRQRNVPIVLFIKSFVQ